MIVNAERIHVLAMPENRAKLRERQIAEPCYDRNVGMPHFIRRDLGDVVPDEVSMQLNGDMLLASLAAVGGREHMLADDSGLQEHLSLRGEDLRGDNSQRFIANRILIFAARHLIVIISGAADADRIPINVPPFERDQFAGAQSSHDGEAPRVNVPAANVLSVVSGQVRIKKGAQPARLKDALLILRGAFADHEPLRTVIEC